MEQITTNVKVIESIEELDSYIDMILTDIEQFCNELEGVNAISLPPLKFQLSTTDDKPYIDTEWMTAIVEYENNIFAAFEKALQRKLTKAEKQTLHFKVYVSKGCSIYELISPILENGSKILGEVKDMGYQQILATTLPFVIGFIICSSFSKVIDLIKTNNRNKLETQIKIKEKEIESKERISSLEIEAQRSKYMLDAQKEALGIISEVIDRGVEGKKAFAKTLSKVQNADFKMNDETYTRASLKEYGKTKRRPKAVKKQVSIDDEFIASKLSFINPIGNEYYFESDKYNFEGGHFTVYKTEITTDIQEAIESRIPVNFHLTCEEKNGVYTVLYIDVIGISKTEKNED